MLIYSICYYYGTNKLSNIDNHLKEFYKIEDEKIFVVNVMIDNHDIEYHSIVKKDLLNYINIENLHILTSYNWGGTILGLWMVYKYCYDKYDEKTYVSHFEEDFIPHNIKWYKDSIEKLDSNNYIYIGESNQNRIKKKNIDGRLHGSAYKNSTRLGNPEVWTDGGFYFLTLKNLKNINDKIGIFHKGDQKIKYERILDGIDLGEVGFPTLLYHAGLRFNVLDRDTYFTHKYK